MECVGKAFFASCLPVGEILNCSMQATRIRLYEQYGVKLLCPMITLRFANLSL